MRSGTAWDIIVRRDYHGTSEEPPAARLLGPRDQEAGVCHAVVRPEPQLHLVGRAETLVESSAEYMQWQTWRWALALAGWSYSSAR